MIHSDFNNFQEMWASAHETMAAGKSLSQKSMSGIFDDLEDYPLHIVMGALKVHRKTAKFAPTVFDIIEIIKDRTGAKHVGVEEAWTIAVESFDEYSTVVWTKEIAEARGIASNLYQQDKVAARMAFKDAYSRIIKTANEPKWFPTVGFDPQRRADAIATAVLLKRLPAGTDAKYRIEAPTMTTQLLIESAQQKTSNVDAIAQLGMLNKIISGVGFPEIDLAGERAEERLAFERKRNAQLDAVEVKMRAVH
jgi:hypothetical protein